MTSQPKFMRYEHHGRMVWAFSQWATQHREMCLCYSCEKMKPGRDNHCPIAQAVFEVDKKYGLVTPVLECPEFKEGEPSLEGG